MRRLHGLGVFIELVGVGILQRVLIGAFRQAAAELDVLQALHEGVHAGHLRQLGPQLLDHLIGIERLDAHCVASTG
jgi:hypothetical protein